MEGTRDYTPTAEMFLYDFESGPAQAVLDGRIRRKVFVYERQLVVRTGREPWDGRDYLVLRDLEDGQYREVAIKDFNADARVAL